jgi:hypothetical protein
MGAINPYRKVSPRLHGTILSGVTTYITFPVGVEYFKISNAAAGGELQWASKAAHITAGDYHVVATGESSDAIISNQLGIHIKASGGDVDYSIFIVVEGR